MKLIVLLASVVGYAFIWFLIPRGRKIELQEAEPYKFERDQAVDGANETFEAWAKLREKMDIAKKEGKI